MKNFIKNNIKQFIILILFILVVNYEFPYYIDAPGGTINLSERMDKDYDKESGSLNMLYVTEYKANVVTLLLAKVRGFDIYKMSEQQVSNETSEEIYDRNLIMLDNSIQNAIFSAYNAAGKEINITGRENYVIAVTKENGFKIGDKILSIDGDTIEDVNTIKSILASKETGNKVKVIVDRNDKEIEIELEIPEDKVFGIMVMTNYLYDVDDEVDFNFKSGEGGSSGGMILSLGIYSKITGIDILKGRNVAGTGTIDMYGNVGEIDGIKYKIAGAVKKNMDVVLVADANYEEAMQVVKDNKYDIEIVSVKTLEDAINYLVN